MPGVTPEHNNQASTPHPEKVQQIQFQQIG